MSIPYVIIMDVAVYSKMIIKYTWEKVAVEFIHKDCSLYREINSGIGILSPFVRIVVDYEISAINVLL